MGENAPRLRHVLVVDDGPWNRRLTTSLLLKLGCTVDVASGGIEAVCKVLSDRYDLVLLDLNMDDIDGVTTLRKIRAGEAQDERVPIWALSADEPPPGGTVFDGWLVKPASVAMLTDVLHELDGFADDRDWPTLSDPAKLAPSTPVDGFPTLSESARGLAMGVAATEPACSEKLPSLSPGA